MDRSFRPGKFCLGKGCLDGIKTVSYTHLFGALDAQTRYQMEEEVLRIWEKEKRTVIFVTNNIEEAVYLGDRIVLLSECPATVKEIYSLDQLPRPRDYVDPEFLRIREMIEDNMDLAL